MSALLLAASAASIPSAYTGDWALAKHGCASGRNHVSLHVARTFVNDGEFDARVERARALPGKRLRLSMTWLSAEDEERQVAIWTLGAGGRSMTQQLVGAKAQRRGLTQWMRCA